MIGNLTRDPELRQTRGGTSIAQLGVAVNESFKDASGQWQERANFFDVTVWGAQADNCAQYLEMGRVGCVVGKLRQERWEAEDGSQRSKVVIVAERVVFLGGAQNDEGAPRAQQGSSGGGSRQQQMSRDGYDDFRDVDFGGDDISF
jgi:single-strand DNA-binding protein